MLPDSIRIVGAYCVGRVHNMLSASVINRNGYTYKWPRYHVSVYRTIDPLVGCKC